MNDTQESPPVVPVVKKCRIEQLFAPRYLELIKSAPNNELVRGFILRIVGKMPPSSENTYEKVQDWLESNISLDRAIQVERQAYHSPAPRPGLANNAAFCVELDFSETERGTCRYSCYNTGIGSFEFTREEVDDLIQEIQDDEGTIEDLIEKLDEIVSEEHYNRCDPSMDGSDYDYDRHDAQDSDGLDYDFQDRRSYKEAVVEYIRLNHPNSNLI